MNHPPIWKVVRNPIQLLAVGFGTGFMPKAPGTAGTLVGIPIVIYVSTQPTVVQGLSLLIMIVLGCYICHVAANSFGNSDPSIIVWDEITGYCVAMFLVPVSVATICIGFILFRCFDIFKPWPISLVERSVTGGVGIMMDDVLAGIFTNLILLGLISFNIL